MRGIDLRSDAGFPEGADYIATIPAFHGFAAERVAVHLSHRIRTSVNTFMGWFS
jgi:hypothetical protein